MKETRFLIVTIALSFLVACASWGIPGAQTFNEKLAAGYIAADKVLTTTDALLVAGKLSAKDAANIVAQDDNVKAGLDIARQINATDATGGSNKLAQVLTGLTALENYLATKGT